MTAETAESRDRRESLVAALEAIDAAMIEADAAALAAETAYAEAVRVMADAEAAYAAAEADATAMRAAYHSDAAVRGRAPLARRYLATYIAAEAAAAETVRDAEIAYCDATRRRRRARDRADALAVARAAVAETASLEESQS
jgi:hypothetical protein